MKAAISSVFYLVLFISVAFLISYLYFNVYTKNANIIARDLITKTEKTKIPIFDINDVSYKEYGSTASLSFTLVNMGDPILVSGWILEFLDDQFSTICRTTVFTGDPLESTRISATLTVVNRNATLDVGSYIASGDIVSVEFTLLKSCLNETINYARNNRKMIFKLFIPPTYRAAILECERDPYTGYASCYIK